MRAISARSTTAQRLAPRARLGLGDAQERVEGAEQPVGLGDGLAQRLGIALRVGLLEQGHLEPRAQPRQRRAQIVGDVVGHLAHAQHQPLDLVEHGVEVGGELVELVAAAGERHALRQIAVDDALAGAVHRLDPAQHVARHEAAPPAMPSAKVSSADQASVLQ